jgi:uncharacterized Zn finger protein (UPF0148 family)
MRDDECPICKSELIKKELSDRFEYFCPIHGYYGCDYKEGMLPDKD